MHTVIAMDDTRAALTNASGPASIEALHRLHRHLVDHLIERMENADDDHPVRASTLSVIRSLLIDNHVSVEDAAQSPLAGLHRLKDTMARVNAPFVVPDDDTDTDNS